MADQINHYLTGEYGLGLLYLLVLIPYGNAYA